uniref:RNA polymerase n=1 Tax=uncultured marine virus TaxID=186617 RepID=A0A0F7LAE3_9VIRU|nr:RNA polymerase [uncultured marine virus]
MSIHRAITSKVARSSQSYSRTYSHYAHRFTTTIKSLSCCIVTFHSSLVLTNKAVCTRNIGEGSPHDVQRSLNEGEVQYKERTFLNQTVCILSKASKLSLKCDIFSCI